MSKIVPFPGHHRAPTAKQIPREEFERLAELALDVVDRIVSILDGDAEASRRDYSDALRATGQDIEGHTAPVIWLRSREDDGAE